MKRRLEASRRHRGTKWPPSKLIVKTLPLLKGFGFPAAAAAGGWGGRRASKREQAGEREQVSASTGAKRRAEGAGSRVCDRWFSRPRARGVDENAHGADFPFSSRAWPTEEWSHAGPGPESITRFSPAFHRRAPFGSSIFQEPPRVLQADDCRFNNVGFSNLRSGWKTETQVNRDVHDRHLGFPIKKKNPELSERST